MGLPSPCNPVSEPVAQLQHEIDRSLRVYPDVGLDFPAIRIVHVVGAAIGIVHIVEKVVHITAYAELSSSHIEFM